MAENQGLRRATYKNATKGSTEELRSRRHQVTVSLRKNKKEDQMLKRRNIDEEDAKSPLKETTSNNGRSPTAFQTLEEIMAGMRSTDPLTVFDATQAARKMLSRERNPPIEAMVKSGLVPLCVQFLDNDSNTNLQFEAAWALTNVASGTSENTQAVVNAGAVPKFVKLLSSPSSNVAEQAVWALGNIAGDGAALRDVVLSNNVIAGLAQLMVDSTPINFLRNIVWLVSNLCRNKEPSPPHSYIQMLIPMIAALIHHNDIPILTDASWAISYITDVDSVKIQGIIDAGCVPRLVAFLGMEEPSIIIPALRSIGNIVTGDDQQTDAVLSAGALPLLKKLLNHSKPNIVKEACWTISNITAGTTDQVQQVIDGDIYKDIAAVLAGSDHKSQKEAAWVVTNTATSAQPQQISRILSENQILKPYCELLKVKDSRMIQVVLNGLNNFFQLAEKLNSTESLCNLIEETGCLDILEELQNHENEEIYKLSFGIIDTYFNENEKTELAPNQNGNTIEFNVESQPNAPEFNF